MAYEQLDLVIQGNASSATDSVDKVIGALNSLDAKLQGTSKSAENSSLFKTLQALSGIGGNYNVKNLTTALEEIKQATNGLKISSTVSKQIVEISEAVNTIDNEKASGFADLASGLSILRDSTNGLKISSTISKSIDAISGALVRIPKDAINKAVTLAQALKSLTSLDKGNIGTVANAIAKIPKSLEQINNLDFGKVETSIQNLTRIMTPLSEKMEKIGNGFAAMPRRVKSFVRALDEGTNSGKKFYSANVGIMGAIRSSWLKIGLLTAVLHNTFGKAINKSNEFVEAINLFDVAMGSAAENAHKFVDKVQDVMGIDPSEWMKAQGTFKMIGSGFGLVEEQANKMSKQLTQLAYDASSFFNISLQDSVLKFQSAFSGELEPVRRLGYALDQVTLQETAHELGITKKIATMNQAEKSMLRYYAMMTQNVQVQGDMARTLDSPANAIRIFKQQLEQLTRAIGNLFIPMLSASLPYIQAFVQVVTNAIHALAKLLGFKLPKFDYSDIQVGISDAVIDATPAVDDLADGFGGVGDNIKDATKQAKEFKNFLLGFDQMHIIPDQDQPTGSSLKNNNGLGGTGGLAGGDDFGGLFDGIELPEYDFLKGATSKIDGIVKKIEGFFGGLKKWFPILAGLGAALAVALGKNWIIGLLDNLIGLSPEAISMFEGVALGIAGIALSAIPAFMSWREHVTNPELMTATDAWINTAAGIAGGALLIAGGITKLMPGMTFLGALPYAVIISGLVGLGAAIVGAGKGYRDLEAAFTNQQFFDGLGTNLSELSGLFGDLMDTLDPTTRSFQANMEQMELNNDVIDESKSSVEYYFKAWSEGVVDTETAVGEIKENLIKLQEATHNNLLLARDNILEGLVGPLKEAVKQSNTTVAEIKEDLDSILTEDQKRTRDTLARLEELSNQYKNDTINIDEYKAKTQELLNGIADVGDTATSTGDLFRDLDRAMADVNWESTASIEDFFDEIYTKAGEGQTRIDEYFGGLEENILLMKESTTDPKLKSAMDELLQINQTTWDERKSEFNTQVAGFYNSAQTEMINQVGTIAKNTSDEWEKKFEEANWLEKILMSVFTPDKQTAYVNSVRDITSSAIGPASEKINEDIEKLGLEGVGNAKSAIDGILDELLNRGIEEGNYHDISTTYGTLSIDEIAEILDNGIKQFEKDFGFKFSETGENIVGGIPKGIARGHQGARDGVAGIGDVVDEEVNKLSFFDKFFNVGQNAVTALRDVFNSADLSGSVGNLANNVLGGFNGLSSNIANVMSNTLAGVGSAFSSFTVKADGAGNGSYRFNTFSPTPVRMFAGGGIPDSGEFYIANENGEAEFMGKIGNRQAVVNQDQMTEALVSAFYPAIYKATKDAYSDSDTNGGDTVVQIDGREIARATREENARLNKRNGKKVVTV